MCSNLSGLRGKSRSWCKRWESVIDVSTNCSSCCDLFRRASGILILPKSRPSLIDGYKRSRTCRFLPPNPAPLQSRTDTYGVYYIHSQTIIRLMLAISSTRRYFTAHFALNMASDLLILSVKALSKINKVHSIPMTCLL